MDPCKYTGNRFQFGDKCLHLDRVLGDMRSLNTVFEGFEGFEELFLVSFLGLFLVLFPRGEINVIILDIELNAKIEDLCA